jgi:hypothetical protein
MKNVFLGTNVRSKKFLWPFPRTFQKMVVILSLKNLFLRQMMEFLPLIN